MVGVVIIIVSRTHFITEDIWEDSQIKFKILCFEFYNGAKSF